MKPTESIKNSRNIHVFRVNRSVKTKERQQSNTNTNAAVNSRTSLSAETKRLICEDHSSNPKYTQEALAKKYGCKRTTVAKVSNNIVMYMLYRCRAHTNTTTRLLNPKNDGYPLLVMLLLLNDFAKEAQDTPS